MIWPRYSPLAAPMGELHLTGGLGDDLIQQRQFALTAAQDAAEPLYVLAL